MLPPILLLRVFQQRPRGTIRMTITSTLFIGPTFDDGRRNPFVRGRFIEMIIAKTTPAKNMFLLVILETRVLAFVEMTPNPILPRVMEERTAPTLCII